MDVKMSRPILMLMKFAIFFLRSEFYRKYPSSIVDYTFLSYESVTTIFPFLPRIMDSF